MVIISNYNIKLFQKIYKELSEQIGIDATISVYKMFKGTQVNFPIRLLDANCVRQLVVKEYDGTNTKELAKKYSYSEKTIQRIIREQKTTEKKE